MTEYVMFVAMLPMRNKKDRQSGGGPYFVNFKGR